jgi:geranylgeranyl diphosphate synthase type I
MQTIAQFVEGFEETFNSVIEAHISRTASHGGTPRVLDQLDHIKKISSHGKRFRPYILSQAYSIYGGKGSIDKIAVSIELLHIFALIHDDIMDRSDRRHGVPTSHIHGTNTYKQINDFDAEHRGESQAILIGDLVFAWSMELFADGAKAYLPEKRDKLYSVYFTLINEVILGQMIDVDISAEKQVSKEMVLTKNILKTANYSFVRPLVLGSILADADNATVSFVIEIGSHLGAAFQAQDDLLDIYGVDTGKDLCTDVSQCQQTLVSAYMYEKGGEYLDSFIEKQGKDLSEKDIDDIKKIVSESGVRDTIQNDIKSSFDKISKMIEPLEEDQKSAWQAIVSLVENRKK